jgi:hypothetical protein
VTTTIIERRAHDVQRSAVAPRNPNILDVSGEKSHDDQGTANPNDRPGTGLVIVGSMLFVASVVTFFVMARLIFALSPETTGQREIVTVALLTALTILALMLVAFSISLTGVIRPHVSATKSRGMVMIGYVALIASGLASEVILIYILTLVFTGGLL